MIRDISDRERAIQHIRMLPLERAYQVTAQPYRQKRSLNANALYWQWVTIAADHFGYDREDMHEALKEACDCPFYEYTSIDGEPRRRRATSKLDSKAMSDYMDRVFRFLVIEHQLRLPIPEEQLVR